MSEELETTSEDKVQQNILRVVLHQIDSSDKKATSIPISGEPNDLDSYLKTLLKEVNNQKQRREYKFQRDSTEFCQALKKFGALETLDLEACDGLASRLLTHESQTDEKYGHLGRNKTSLVTKGSFLQFLYRSDGILSYLGVKLDHQSFLDEADFKRKSGLPDTTKIYKSCRVIFGKDKMPVEVAAYDTNSTPSQYWWNGFLELAVIRDDEENTKKASKAVLAIIHRIRKKFPADHTLLRNAAITALKKDQNINFDEFVTDLISQYSPIDDGLKQQLPLIETALRSAPLDYHFDSQFTLIPKSVPYRSIKVKLSDEITLTFDSTISNMAEKIWSEETSDGKKLVVIESPDAFNQFVIKKRA